MSNVEDTKTMLAHTTRKRQRSYDGGDVVFQQTSYGDASSATNPQLDVLSDDRGDRQLETLGRGLMVLSAHKGTHDERTQKETCPKCHGARWLRSPLPPWDPDYRSRVECECLLEERSANRRQEMLHLCIQLGFKPDMTFATYLPQVRGVQQAARATKDFIEFMMDWGIQWRDAVRAGSNTRPPGRWMVFVGPVGVGKTHLAMAIGNACINANIETLFATVPDLLDHLRAAFAPTSAVVYDTLFQRLRTCELLILDDLGAERSSSWADEKLFQLFNYRYNRCLPTIVTMNQKAWIYLDDRLQSRLSDAVLVSRVMIEQAKDYRMYQKMKSSIEISK